RGGAGALVLEVGVAVGAVGVGQTPPGRIHGVEREIDELPLDARLGRGLGRGDHLDDGGSARLAHDSRTPEGRIAREDRAPAARIAPAGDSPQGLRQTTQSQPFWASSSAWTSMNPAWVNSPWCCSMFQTDMPAAP